MIHTGLGFASEPDDGATHTWLLLAALPWGTGVPWLLAHLCNFPTEISLSEPIGLMKKREKKRKKEITIGV